MKSTKWYNWTGDAMWDEYCKITGIFILAPGIFMLGVMLALLVKGFTQ